MSRFVESLKRLYESGKIGQDKINELAESRKLAEEEKTYILN